MTSSNLLDCTTGNSRGLRALEDATGIDADLTICVVDVVPRFAKIPNTRNFA
jgi:hypothetical protein